MVQRNMRFVLEEGNTLTLRESDGTCVRVAEDIVPKHHRLLIKSEDLVYITYKHPNFHYKRYNPQTLELELLETIQLDPEQDDEDSIIPLAAYCSDTGKVFFITVSKETRDIWVRETDNSGARKVDGKFPKDLLRRENLGNNKTSFLSAHIGQSEHKYAVFLSAKYRRGVWTIAIDVPKNGDKIKLFQLEKNREWSQYKGGEPFYFGNGIEPQSISIGLGGHVLHATPQKEGAMEVEDDSIWFYKMRYFTFRTALALFGWMIVSAVLAFFTTPLLSTSWIECIEGANRGCSPLSYAEKFFLNFSCVLLLIIATHLACWRLFPKSLIRHNQMVGVGIYPPAFRSGKIYNYRLFKFTSLEKFHVTSPSTIAFLQEDKIQTYDFIENKIIEKPIRDFFGGYSFIRQIFCEDKENLTIGAYKNKGTFLEVKLCDVGTAEVNTISFSISHEMDDQPNQANSISDPSDQDGPVSLRMVLIDYREDAFEPFKPNKRVRIEHTTNPMRLIIQAPTNSRQIDFYTRLRHSPKIWSTLKQISNLTDFVHEHDNENGVVFELDKKKTLVQMPDFFDHFSQRGEGTFSEDQRLRQIKGNKELAPSLETAIFLENDINHPVTVFLSNFSDNFPKLMKSLWVGDRNQEILQLEEIFNIEDDLPAMSYIQGKEGEYEGASPKQNTEMWQDWKDYLPWTELNAVFEIIEEKELWPRNGHAHQMMHGDLRPANVVVSDGEVIGYECIYDLFLCDFPDVVAKSEEGGEILYRTEIVDGTHRVTSHFFETEKAPKINPMLDLARFFAYMLIKIPFEPTAKDAVGLAKEKRNRRTLARNARQDDFKDTVREQLDRALTWSENNLLKDCVLVEEGEEDSWRELLKAMIFDQCIQIMMHWKRGRSEAAIDKDLTPENLCEIFYDVSPNTPDLIIEEEDLSDREIMRMAAARIYATDQDQPWNEEVVKLEITDYRVDLDYQNTTLHEYDVSENHLPGIMEKVIENGFPINSFRRKTSTQSDRDSFNFRFEADDFQWLCSCYIQRETMVISYMHEDVDWDWEWEPHWS